MSTKSLTISVFIAGAEKAGTSSLLTHLGRSDLAVIPTISGNPAEAEFASEFPFFLSDSVDRNVDIDEVLRSRISSGFAADKHLIVAKNVDLCTDRAAMLRLREHSPDVKVIFLLREPISRAISSHGYQLFRGAESEADFTLAAKACLKKTHVADRHTDYLRRGLYSSQAADLIDVFGAENCLFLCFEDIVFNSKDCLDQVCDFVGLPNSKLAAVERVNAAKEPRSYMLAKLLYRDNVPKRVLRQILPLGARVRLAATIRRLNSRENRRKAPNIPPYFRSQLRDYFRDDLEKTERITGLNILKRWGY